MNNTLEDRLNKIVGRITTHDFISARGIGNEIAFYIFDYPPAEELRIRQYITFLLETLARKKAELRPKHINLFRFLVEYLRERGFLEKCFALQHTRGDAALYKALKGILDGRKIARHFKREVQPEVHDLVLVSGVGSVYPLLRTHTLLHNLSPIMGNTPLIVFFPGEYKQGELRIFGEGRSEMQANYYRAFRLID